MNRVKIAIRNLKVNKLRSLIYFVLMVIIVSAQLLSYVSYQQFNELHSNAKYDLRRYTGLGVYESAESSYKKNPYLYITKMQPTLIGEEEYEDYKKSSLIESSSYRLGASVVATANATKADLGDNNSYMYWWPEGEYIYSKPEDKPELHMSIFSLSSMESMHGSKYDYTLVSGVDTLADGEVLLEEEMAELLKVDIGDTIPIHQPIYVNGNYLSEDDTLSKEEQAELYVNYSLKVAGVYKLEYKNSNPQSESGYDEDYEVLGASYTNANTIIEYDNLIRESSKTKQFNKTVTMDSFTYSNVEFVLKNPNDKQKLQDELNEKGLNHRYLLISNYESVANGIIPVTNVISQLQIAFIIITIIAVITFVIMMLYENKKRINETSVLYLLGYSKKDIWLVMFIEKLLLLFVAAVVAVIVTSLFARELVGCMLRLSYEHYYVDILGYEIIDDNGNMMYDPYFMEFTLMGDFELDSINDLINIKVGLQPLHFIVLVVTCGLQALLASGWILWKKVSDFDFLGRK